MLDYLFTKTPIAFFTQNLWRDEAYSYLLAKKSIFDIIQLTAGDFSPPLYYLILHVWIRIFGTSEVMLRSLSLVFFAATLYIVFEILMDVFKLSKIKSLLYLLLFALNPFLVYYAFEARMYMMVTFFITLAYYAFWMKKRRLYILSMVLALYTHYFAIFILIAHFLEILWRNYSYKLKLKPFHFSFSHIKGCFSIKPLIITGLLFIPWGIYLLSTRDVSDVTFWIVVPPIKDIWYVPFVLFTGYERVFGQYYHDQAGYTSFHADMLKLLYGILLLPLLIYLFNSYRLKRQSLKNTSVLNHISNKIHQTAGFFKERTLLSSLFIWAFFTPYGLLLLSYFAQPYYLPRYFIFASVGFLLLIVYAFEHMIVLKKPSLSTFAGIVLLALLIITMNRFNKLNLKYRSKRNVSQMSEEIKALMNKNDYAYVTSELDYHLYQYYLGTDRIKIYGKTYDQIPQYVGKVLIPEEALASQFPVFPARAFIIYYNSYSTKALY